jgi:hypothetical protein
MSDLDDANREGFRNIVQTTIGAPRFFLKKRDLVSFGLGTRLAEKTNGFSTLADKTPASYARLLWDWFSTFMIGMISVLALIVGFGFIILFGDFILIEIGYGPVSRIILALFIGIPVVTFSIVYTFFLTRDNLILYRKHRIKK